MILRKSFYISFFIILAACAARAGNNSSGGIVNIIPAPAGSLVPDVVMDNSGTLHMVYCLNQNAYYMRSTDNGNTFSPAVKVNSSGTVEYAIGERGPKLSVGSDGTVHVVWMDHWSSGVNVYARYTRSTDGGNSFETFRAVSASAGVDGVSVAADGIGNVFVFWHTMVPVQTQVPQATWLHFARSSDNGLNFSADTNLNITNHSGLACSMCMTRARFGAGGKVYLAFRSAENSIRDFFVLKSNSLTSNNFTSVRVNNDNWNINYCPMVGPELETGNGGIQFCAFMSNYHVYWAVSDPDVTAFTQHVATPLNEDQELFPAAVQNQAGKILFVWQVGPMSVSDSATIKWAVYNEDGTLTGLQGTAGRTFSGTKATAFVGTDDNFYIVANVENTVSVPSPQKLSQIRVFPNPARSHILISGISEKTKIILYTIEGKPVLETEVTCNTALDVSRVASGQYNLFLEIGRKSLKKILIIIHDQ